MNKIDDLEVINLEILRNVCAHLKKWLHSSAQRFNVERTFSCTAKETIRLLSLLKSSSSAYCQTSPSLHLMSSGHLNKYTARWECCPPPRPGSVPRGLALREWLCCSHLLTVIFINAWWSEVSHKLNQYTLSFHFLGIKNCLISSSTQFSVNLPPIDTFCLPQRVICTGLLLVSPPLPSISGKVLLFLGFTLSNWGGTISNKILSDSTQDIKNVKGYMMNVSLLTSQFYCWLGFYIDFQVGNYFLKL